MSVIAMSLLAATGKQPAKNCNTPWEKESDIVMAASRGDSAAFRTLCDSHTRRIQQTLLRITRNREDAEDALQDALLRAFTHLRDFDCRSSFSTWLTRIAINSALMILRKKRSSLEVSMDDFGDSEATRVTWQVPDLAPDPEKQYIQKERQHALRRAIHKLRPRIREIVEMHHLGELSMKEAAQTMGVSVVAAKARLFHAKVALRKTLRPKTFAPFVRRTEFSRL